MNANFQKTETGRHSRNDRSVSFALILLTAGVILLLNNLGHIPWSVWNTLFHFWPILLIISGFDMLMGDDWFSAFLVFLFSLTLILFVVCYSVATVVPNFDRYLENTVPVWKTITRLVPQQKGRRFIIQQNLPSGNYFFYC